MTGGNKADAEVVGGLWHGGAPDQIGIVVENIDEALARYSDLWPGLGEWRCYTYSPETVQRLEYNSVPSSYAMRIALAGASPQVELIEPLSGPNIYEGWLEQHGQGVHHFGLYVQSLSTELERLRDTGVKVAQAGFGFGLDGDGGFAYLDTISRLGYFVELIELPTRRRQPEKIWPA
jgi:methylmalonyl-CoA/ethylmalonyl-CoA epimerase